MLILIIIIIIIINVIVIIITPVHDDKDKSTSLFYCAHFSFCVKADPLVFRMLQR